mmetsp:Transcript_26322/g.30438  ORF Transcript_26322/g.30438 Transcript_26322/m.30438 type:complete len:89 (+) Transcript_26322:309-575(+)
MMTQSSPFPKQVKKNSPMRSEFGMNSRVAQSRVSRYNLNREEVETYSRFVDLISMFDKQSMRDILEDAMKDAEEKRGTGSQDPYEENP